MKVIAVDDEQLALESLVEGLKAFSEIEEVSGFQNAHEALSWLEKNQADAAFLDIHMRGMDGLALAKGVKEYCPCCSVVFVTGYDEYAVEAFRIHASGYLMKPVGQEDIRRELDHILSPVLPSGKGNKRIRVQCFGNFEVFVDGEPMKFQHSKTKELFAYLVDRRGASCDINTLCAVLWENKPGSPGVKSQLRHLIADLTAALKRADSADVLVRRRGMVSVLPEKIQCDYYDWLKGEVPAVNAYGGEYMCQYSWAEMTTGLLGVKVFE